VSRKTPPEFQQMLDSLMSKPWQDFFTMLFLAAAMLYALVAGFRNGFLRRDLPPQTQFAYGALFLLLGVLPLTFFAFSNQRC
jgi:hypothetical protein